MLKCRQVRFYLDPDKVTKIMARLTAEILPMFEKLPHFRGYLALESDHGTLREIVISSFWDDGLDDSQEVSDAFVLAVHEMAETNPSRETYDILGALVTDEVGHLRIELD